MRTFPPIRRGLPFAAVYNSSMPVERDKMSEKRPSNPIRKQERTLGVSVGLGVTILLASAVTGSVMFVIGATVGTHLSAAGGPINEHHMGHGVMTGVVAGIFGGGAVGLGLARYLLRRHRNGTEDSSES